MQAYLGDRSSYQERGRLLELQELAWSLGFVVGGSFHWLADQPVGLAGSLSGLSGLGMAGLIVILFFLPAQPGNGRHENGFSGGAFGDVFRSPVALAGLALCLSDDDWQ